MNKYVEHFYLQKQLMDMIRKNECKDVLRAIFPNHIFQRNYMLKWFPNSCVILDYYNKELNLGLEYNGYHYFYYPNYYHTTREEFIDECIQNEYKKQLIKLSNINLIMIKYDIVNLKTYILSYLRYAGYQV